MYSSAAVVYFLIGDIEYSRPEKVFPPKTSISLLTPAQLLRRFSSTNTPTAMVVLPFLGSVSSWRITFRNFSLHIRSNVTQSFGGRPSISLKRFTCANLKGRRELVAAADPSARKRKNEQHATINFNTTEGYEEFCYCVQKEMFFIMIHPRYQALDSS